MKPFLYKEFFNNKQNSNCIISKIHSTYMWRVLWHYHPDEFEIFFPTIILDTECMVGDYKAKVKNGEIYLVPPYLPHSFHSIEEPKDFAKCNHTFRAIRFNNDFVRKLGALGAETRKLQSFLENTSKGIMFYDESAWKIQKLMVQLVKRDNDGSVESFYDFLEIIRIMYDSCEYKTLSSKSANEFIETDSSNRIDRILQYLHSNFHEELTLEDISKAVYMSVTNMSRTFKKSTGRTIICYLNELRIANAAILLIETNDTILDISLNSGFSNISYFNRKFRAIKGMSPREYRKQKKIYNWHSEEALEKLHDEMIAKSSL